MTLKTSLDPSLFFCRTNSFLNEYLPSLQDKSAHTRRSYSDSLVIFRRYIGEYNDPVFTIHTFHFSDCTYDLMLNFTAYLQNKRKNKPATVNSRITAVKGYLRYAADLDISVTPTWLIVSRVPLLTLPKLQRPIVEDEELAAILDAPKTGKHAIRDRCILNLFFDSGIRADELIHLCVGSLNLGVKEPYIRVHGKGNKERIVPLSPKMVSHVKSYLKNIHMGPDDKDTPLFYSNYGGKVHMMTERNVERIVKKYADAVRETNPNLPRSVYPHMFRRTRATGLYRDGVELEMVSRILGHSSTETTKRYAIPSVEMMRAAMKMDEEEEQPLWEKNIDEEMELCGLRK